jgi:hypothetical protein
MNEPTSGVVSAGDRLEAMAARALEQIAAVDRIEGELTAAKAALDRTQRVDLPELMKDLNLSEATLPGAGITIKLTMGVDASIPEAHRAEAFAWMAENGYGALVRAEVKVVFGAAELEKAEACAALLTNKAYETEVKMSVPPPTLKAWANERLSAGADIPPELFNVRSYDMARISNSKRKR